MFILEFVSTLILGLVTFATVVDRERNMSDNAAPLVARPPPSPATPGAGGTQRAGGACKYILEGIERKANPYEADQAF